MGRKLLSDKVGSNLAFSKFSFAPAINQLTRRAKELDPPDKYHARRRRKRSGMGAKAAAFYYL